jgi:hypothetical protein
MYFLLVFLLVGASSYSNGRGPGLSFALIKPRYPARGLFPSAVVHAAILSFCLYPPLFNSLIPPRIVEKHGDYLRPSQHDSLVMTNLSYLAKLAMAPAKAPSQRARQSSDKRSPQGKAYMLDSPVRREKTPAAQPTYSGPQEIVSIIPNSTNSVQTILRPDLVSPPTLKFPQLLKPLVILPSIAPEISEVKPADPAVVPASTPGIKNTARALPKENAARTAPLPPAETPARPLPQIESGYTASRPPAVIVLNAVTVPENAPLVLPQASLPGTFAVGPVNSAKSSGNAGTLDGSIAFSDAGKTLNKFEQRGRGIEIDPLSETSIGNNANQSTAIIESSSAASASNSNPNGSSQAPGDPQGANIGSLTQAAHGVPGITIIGGTSRDGNRGGVISATTHASYGLTVISSGTSGGASRDSGFFERSETVYTVYIPMADAGGGPDWSIQYAILGPRQAGNGLLTPPVAVKTVRAVVTGDLPDASGAVIFFSGVISANGKLIVKPIRQMDARARQAMDTLCHWEFLPAQLNGIAVAIKVLIGVAIVSP